MSVAGTLIENVYVWKMELPVVLSVSFTVRDSVWAEVGVPVILTVVPLTLAARVPLEGDSAEVMEIVRLPLPPLPLIEPLYATLVYPAARVPLEGDSAMAASIVIVNACVAVLLSESVTLAVKLAVPDCVGVPVIVALGELLVKVSPYDARLLEETVQL